jgi:hypothetical protein
MDIVSHATPGIHVLALEAEEAWVNELRHKAGGRYNKGKFKTAPGMKECPQCGKKKDSACFQSHRTFEHKKMKTHPICNACRSDNAEQAA